MLDVLPAAAFGLVPSGQLFARELHAASAVGLAAEQIPSLVESCTVYTADSDTLMVRMVDDVSRVHGIMYGPVRPSSVQLEAVDMLLTGWADNALELGRTWVRHRMSGVRELDADQIRRISFVYQDVSARLAAAMVHARVSPEAGTVWIP